MMTAARSAFFSFIGRLHAFMFGTDTARERRAENELRRAEEGRDRGEPPVVKYEDRTEIHLYDYVDSQMMVDWWGIGVSDVGFMKALDKANATGKPVLLRINSGGGDVFAGLTIASAVAEHGLDVVVDGVAASIASVIMARAKRATMKLGATVMLHNPSSGVMGNARQMRAEAAVLDKLRDAMIDVYQARTGDKHTREQWAATLDGVDGADGTWWTGAQAVANGFADEYEQPRDAEARAEANVRLAGMLDTRKNVAAVMGVQLPKILETEVDPGPQTSPAPDDKGPEGAATGDKGQKPFQPSVRVSHRPGTFYVNPK